MTDADATLKIGALDEQQLAALALADDFDDPTEIELSPEFREALQRLTAPVASVEPPPAPDPAAAARKATAPARRAAPANTAITTNAAFTAIAANAMTAVSAAVVALATTAARAFAAAIATGRRAGAHVLAMLAVASRRVAAALAPLAPALRREAARARIGAVAMGVSVVAGARRAREGLRPAGRWMARAFGRARTIAERAVARTAREVRSVATLTLHAVSGARRRHPQPMTTTPRAFSRR